MGNSVIFFIYFILRMSINQPIIPSKESIVKDEADYYIMWLVFNTILVVICMQKLLYYMQVSKSLSVMSFLVFNVFQQAASFSVFYLIWVFFMFILFSITGCDFSGDDYP